MRHRKEATFDVELSAQMLEPTRVIETIPAQSLTSKDGTWHWAKGVSAALFLIVMSVWMMMKRNEEIRERNVYMISSHWADETPPGNIQEEDRIDLAEIQFFASPEP